jgi:hypothetical protein
LAELTLKSNAGWERAEQTRKSRALGVGGRERTRELMGIDKNRPGLARQGSVALDFRL